MTANARRLQRVGLAVLAYPAVTFVGRLLLRRMVEALDLARSAVSVDIGVADWWAWVYRGMTFTELSGRVGMTLANLSILKTGRAKANPNGPTSCESRSHRGPGPMSGPPITVGGEQVQVIGDLAHGIGAALR